MPNFTYNTNIPAAANNPSVDQPNMQTNTNSINSILNVDMIGFGDNDGGYHSKLTLVNQGSNPGSSAGQYVEYSKSVSGASELFVQKDGSATPIQLSRGVPVNPVGNTAGFTYLPGGYYLIFGNIGINPSGTLNFPAGVTLTNLWSFSATSDQPVALYKSGSSATSITISRVSGSGAVGAYITVIGS